MTLTRILTLSLSLSLTLALTLTSEVLRLPLPLHAAWPLDLKRRGLLAILTALLQVLTD